MKPRIEYNDEKNLVLKETRGVCFEDVIRAIEEGNLIDDLSHHDKVKYPDQRILVVKIKNYVYAVPYVFDEKRGVIFLKTVYPSRVLNEKYLEVSKK